MRRPGVDIFAALGVAVLAVAAVNAWLATTVSREETLYQADHVAHWAMSVDLARRLQADPLAALGAVASSFDRPLNLLPVLPVATVLTVAGESRVAYVLTVANLYALPSLMILVLLVRRACADTSWLTAAGSALLASLLLLPALWQPVLLGYVGVGGIGLALLAWLLYVVPERAPSMPVLVATGVLLALLLLLRRWWGFWTVAFCLLVLVDGLLRMGARRHEGWRRAAVAFWPPVAVAGVVAGTLLLVAAPRIVTVLTTDYADRFAAYKHVTGLPAELGLFVDRFGLVVLAAATGAAAILGLQSRLRRLAVLAVAQGVVVLLAMRRIQDPSPQHWYLYLPTLLVLLAVGIAWLVRGRRRLAALGIAACAGALVTAAALIPLQSAPWTPEARIQPMVRDDIAEVRRLLETLDELQDRRPGWIYVLDPAGVLPDTALGYAGLSLGTELPVSARILGGAHVDRRDGFPYGIIAASYVVLTVPRHGIAPASHSLVVTVPSQQLLDGTGIGAAFRRLPVEVELERGARGLLYERVRSHTPEEVASLDAPLRRAYPDRPELHFHPPEAEATGGE